MCWEYVDTFRWALNGATESTSTTTESPGSKELPSLGLEITIPSSITPLGFNYEMNALKIIALTTAFASLTSIAPQSLAGGEKTSSCPEPTEHVREALEDLAQGMSMLAEAGGRSAPPESALQSVERGDVRRLVPERDEKACRTLYDQGHSEFLDKTWNQEFSIQGSIYPLYDAGYYKGGDYYFALFVRTPTPQDDDLSQTRVVTGYSTALIYDQNFEKIAGYSF